MELLHGSQRRLKWTLLLKQLWFTSFAPVWCRKYSDCSYLTHSGDTFFRSRSFECTFHASICTLKPIHECLLSLVFLPLTYTKLFIMIRLKSFTTTHRFWNSHFGDLFSGRNTFILFLKFKSYYFNFV